MDENLNEKISALLSSPDLMANIQNVLSGLSGENSSSNSLTAKNESSPGITDVVQALSSNNILTGLGNFLKENQSERIALLSALRPFLSSEKQETLDLIIQLLKVAGILFATNIMS